MGDRKPQVNVALDEERKDRWEQAVEEDGRFSSMSQLIRTSVEKELNDNHGRDDGKQVAKLAEKIESLENSIGGLSNDVGEVKGIVQNQTPNQQHLRSEVFAALPDGDMAAPVSPQEVAEKIGGPVDSETVGDVLENLSINTGQVEEIIGTEEGDVRYKKEGDSV